MGHSIRHRLAIVGPIRFKLERDIVGLQNNLEVRIGVELVLSEFLEVVCERGRVGGRRQMVLEGLEDPVPHPCLWNSERILGRLNRRGVADGEFGHSLKCRALDKFTMAHSGLLFVGLNRRILLLFKPCLSIFYTLWESNPCHLLGREAFYH